MIPYTTDAMFCRIHRSCAIDPDRCEVFDSIEFIESAASVGLDTALLVCDILPVHIVECQRSSL